MRAHLYKAFTNDKKAGNPAGVIELDAPLSDSEMVRIAAALNFSESAFISTSQKVDYQIRFFSPTQEVNFCGHAALASVKYWHEKTGQDLIRVQSNKAITTFNHNAAGFTFPMQSTEFLGDFTASEIAPLFNLKADEISKQWPIELVSVGSPKIIMFVETLSQLKSIEPNLEAMKKKCLRSPISGFYAVTTETLDPNNHFHARQFNPAAGINEDPVTGIAAGALGAYVQKHQRLNKNTIIVEQGHFLSQAGHIMVKLDTLVQIGGEAVKFGEKELIK